MYAQTYVYFYVPAGVGQRLRVAPRGGLHHHLRHGADDGGRAAAVRAARQWQQVPARAAAEALRMTISSAPEANLASSRAAFRAARQRQQFTTNATAAGRTIGIKQRTMQGSSTQ